MTTPFDAAALVARLKGEGVQAEVQPSAVCGSRYPYVYVYLTPDRDEGRHIIVSDGAEYGEPGLLVGIHAHCEEALEAMHEVADEDAAVAAVLGAMA